MSSAPEKRYKRQKDRSEIKKKKKREGRWGILELHRGTQSDVLYNPTTLHQDEATRTESEPGIFWRQFKMHGRVCTITANDLLAQSEHSPALRRWPVRRAYEQDLSRWCRLCRSAGALHGQFMSLIRFAPQSLAEMLANGSCTRSRIVTKLGSSRWPFVMLCEAPRRRLRIHNQTKERSHVCTPHHTQALANEAVLLSGLEREVPGGFI